MDAESLRADYLEELAALYANTGKASQSTIVTQLRRHERTRALFRRCNTALKRPTPRPVAQVLITSPGGNISSIIDKSPMEAAFNRRNHSHFSQADGTPFTAFPLVTTYGPHGTNTPTRRLLQGQIDIQRHQVSEATYTLLTRLQLLNVSPIDIKMYVEEIIKAYTIWRESTSTSPYGDHLGHDKALLRKTKRQKVDDDPTKGISYRMFKIKTQILNLTLQYGIVLDRWTNVVNAMIEKDPGKPNIERFRVIHIIPADFNMMMGILFGYRLMNQGELLQQFGEEQSGSRKQKDCQDVQHFKHCIYSIVRLTKAQGSTFDNDAKSCFDRIVMLLPSILSQRLGMPAKACQLFLATLEKIKYHTKTIHGISEATYSTSADHTIHGPGQGSKAAPAIWTVVSCYLLAQMHLKSRGVSITDPQNNITHHQSSSGFVDDITHWNIDVRDSLLRREPIPALISTTTTTAQWWENLLHSSGGTLELSKCFYYMFHWSFAPDGSGKFSTPDEYPHQVSLTNSVTNVSTPIDHKPCHKCHKTLGKLENPSGNYDDEAARIRSKADSFANHVQSSALSADEAGILYSTIYIPSVCYGFASGCMSLKQAEKAQSQFTMAILPRLGYNRNTPRAVMFAESTRGGAGLRHLFAEQGTRQIGALMFRLRKETPLGKTILIQLKWAQRICGTSIPIFQDTDRSLPHLGDEKWILTLQQFLRLSDLTLLIPPINTPSPQRINDRAIMDIVTTGKTYKPREIKIINRCRLHLRVETVSDITDASGDSLTLAAILCGPPQDSNTLWPCQPCPTTTAAWKKFTTSLCNEHTHTNSNTPSAHGWKTPSHANGSHTTTHPHTPSSPTSMEDGNNPSTSPATA